MAEGKIYSMKFWEWQHQQRAEEERARLVEDLLTTDPSSVRFEVGMLVTVQIGVGQHAQGTVTVLQSDGRVSVATEYGTRSYFPWEIVLVSAPLYK